jgi:hypothetical protein
MAGVLTVVVSPANDAVRPVTGTSEPWASRAAAATRSG